MAHPQTLENVFGAFVNQSTLDEAARWMASLARSDEGLKKEFADCLTHGIRLAEAGSLSVVAAVNRSGYQVSSPQEAKELCGELLSLFQQALHE